MMKTKPAWLRERLPFYMIASLLALVFLLPLVWMVVYSLRTPGLPPPRGLEWLPRPLSWGNYRTLFEILPFGRYLLNSVVVTSLAVALTLLSASLAGFGMAQLSRADRRRLLVLSIGLLMIPITSLWLTRFLLFAWLKWTDTYLALLAPAFMGSSPFFILSFYWAFRRLPEGLIEAARLEGASLLTAWRQVGLPLVRPTTGVVAVLTFILYWNDFINPLLYIKSQHMFTLAVGLQQLQQLDRTNWPILLAGSLVMTLPLIGLFVLIQRQMRG